LACVSLLPGKRGKMPIEELFAQLQG